MKHHALLTIFSSKAIALVTCWAVSASAQTKTWVGGADLWHNDAAWSPPGAPALSDTVLIPSGAVTLARSASVASLSLTNARLEFANWDTVLTVAGDVSIWSDGIFSHITNSATAPSASGEWLPDARVHVVCSNLTIHPGGSIHAAERGFRGGLRGSGVATDGAGPGGTRKGGVTSGAGHAGYGGSCGALYHPTSPRGEPYGSAQEPVMPGSGAGGSLNDPRAGHGGNGGGAVRIVASGTVTVNGVIDVSGGHCAGPYQGGGSGGSLWITCVNLVGTGLLRANGGNGHDQAGGGAGGRIALDYVNATGWSGAIQCRPGVDGNYPGNYNDPYHGIAGDIGTLWAPTADILKSPLAGHHYLWVNAPSTYAFNHLHITDSDVRIETDAIRMTVSNDLTLLQQGRLTLGQENLATGVTLTVGGHLSISNGALTICGGRTDLMGTNLTALITVQGDITIEDGGSLRPCTQGYTNAGAVAVHAARLLVKQGGRLDAGGAGYRVGYGPRREAETESPQGEGTKEKQNGSGEASIASSKPWLVPGAGASQSFPTHPARIGRDGGEGGGALWVHAAQRIAVDGFISADGASGTRYTGGGDAGALHLFTRRFGGTGRVSAAGGNSGGNYPGGHGGQVTISATLTNEWAGVISVAGGLGVPDGRDGRQQWITRPAPGKLLGE